jgi:hypothetical protein
MAVITINMGGRPMAVDVPDFAMESTQQDVRSAISQLTAQLQGLKASNQGVSQGEQAVVRAVKDLDSDDKFRKNANAMGNAVQKGYQKAMSSVPSMAKGAGDPGMMANMFKAVGVGTLATQLGMAAGAAQELSKVMAFGGSVGLSFNGNIQETAYSLAEIGLRLDQFGDIVGTNLSAMYELGGSVDEGSQRFIKLVERFRGATESMGYFGMASDEMAQFMAEELELRRRVMDSDQLRIFAEQQLVDVMNKNFTEQEKMARITGQNVRERIRAQMAAKADERMQFAQMSMTEDQRRAVNDVMAGLSTLSPALQDAMRESITMGLFKPGTEFMTKGGQMAQRSPELMRIIQEGIKMAQSGAGSDGVNDRMLDLAKAFKDNKANARTLAELGFIGGDAISKEIASGFLEMNELTKNSTAARKSLDEEEFKAREEYIRSMRGYNAKLDEFYAASLNRVMDFTFAMTGNDASDFVKSMDNLVSGMTNMMTSDYAKAAATAFGEAFGEMAFQPFMRTFGLDPNEDRDVIDVLKVTGMIGGGMGAIPPQLAKLLQGPGNIRGMFRGAEAGLKSMFPQFIENKGTENETFNYDKFIEEATKVTADLTNDTITRLTTKLAPLIKN